MALIASSGLELLNDARSADRVTRSVEKSTRFSSASPAAFPNWANVAAASRAIVSVCPRAVTLVSANSRIESAESPKITATLFWVSIRSEAAFTASTPSFTANAPAAAVAAIRAGPRYLLTELPKPFRLPSAWLIPRLNFFRSAARYTVKVLPVLGAIRSPAISVRHDQQLRPTLAGLVSGKPLLSRSSWSARKGLVSLCACLCRSGI